MKLVLTNIKHISSTEPGYLIVTAAQNAEAADGYGDVSIELNIKDCDFMNMTLAQIEDLANARFSSVMKPSADS
jgi:hypothetical protein